MASTVAGPSGALGIPTNSTGSIDFRELADRCKTLGIEAQFNPSIAEKAALIESANQTRAWKRNERKKLAQRIRDAIQNAEDALNDADAAAVNDLEPLVAVAAGAAAGAAAAATRGRQAAPGQETVRPEHSIHMHIHACVDLVARTVGSAVLDQRAVHLEGHPVVAAPVSDRNIVDVCFRLIG